MALYDINVILEPTLNESQIQIEKDAVATQVERTEGTITGLDEWGNRRLAYPIQKHNDGYYLIYGAELSEEAPQAIERNLKTRDYVMRVMITRVRPEERTRKEKEKKTAA
ncbi:MAG: 30S ribosomal protein S6 [Trueperaceae bacterium]|nr:30S ribosomal protein S6 [Trueperaceae bacterium]